MFFVCFLTVRPRPEERKKIARFLGKHTFFKEKARFLRKHTFFKQTFAAKQSRKDCVFTKIVRFPKNCVFFLSCGQGLRQQFYSRM
jgi:hypothetical protein